jgi:hypothetical protein
LAQHESIAEMTFAERKKRWLIRLLWRLPHFIAVPWAESIKTKTKVHNDTGWCFPCHAGSRVVAAQHKSTVGPARNVYCSKCGLNQPWPRYCANKVVQVNNPKRRSGKLRHFQMFWD